MTRAGRNARPETAPDPAYDVVPPATPRPIVIIGAGGIVRDAHVPAYAKAGYPIASICDVKVDRARALAERNGIPAVYSTPQDAIAAAPNDAVFDLPLMPAVQQQVLPMLPEGAPALLQKPLGDTLAEGLQTRAICHRKRLIAAVNTQLRFAPYIAAARRLIADGAIGELYDLQVRVQVHTPWEMFPEVLKLNRLELNMHSVHYLDLVRSFLGDPDGVACVTVPRPDTNVKNTRSDIILYYRDRPVRVVVSTNHDYHYGPEHEESFIQWQGTGGVIRAQMGLLLDYPTGGADGLEMRRDAEPDRGWQSVPFTGSWFPDAFAASMGALQRYLDGTVPTLPTGVDDVIRTMAVVEAGYSSNAIGGTAPAYPAEIV